MSAIDFERVLLGLKKHIVSKRSHGQPELLAKIAELEVEYAVPEGQEGWSDLPLRHQPSVGEPEHVPAR